MPVMGFADRLAALDRVDAVVRRLSGFADRFPTAARDALHGVWLGHPLHPAVAQVTVGVWVGACALDVVASAAPGGRERQGIEGAATSLIAVGLVSLPATALPGFMDWSRLHREQQRIGLVHAGVNALAAVCMAASLGARVNGHPGRGRGWSFGGLTLAWAGAALGGHLAYRYAAGANHAQDVPHVAAAQWTPIGLLDDLPQRRPLAASVGERRVVVVRQGDDVAVLVDTCSHLSGPLSDGMITTLDGRDCLVCPWHGSTFELASGRVVHGPATAPQPVFDVRVVDGAVSARVRGPERAARTFGGGRRANGVQGTRTSLPRT